MIELTTGIAFLITSIYGSTPTNVNSNIEKGNLKDSDKQIVMNEADFKDTKAVEAYVKKSYSDNPILVDIARCESTFRQFDENGNIIRGKVNKADIGVMQINETWHAEEANKLGYNIYTTTGNIAYAKYLYEHQGSDPWSSSSPCWSEKVLARSN